MKKSSFLPALPPYIKYCLLIGFLLINPNLQAQPEENPGQDTQVEEQESQLPAAEGELSQAVSVLLDRLTQNSSGFETQGKEFIHPEDPLEALQGRIPGVQVSSLSGAPGEETWINIRGLNTFLFNHDPVIMVDGVQSLSTLDLNYQDIESIHVVKDLATTVLLGSKGAGGVVLISTKEGLSGKNAVCFNVSFGMTTPPAFLDLLTGEQAFGLMQELNAPFLGTGDDRSIYWGPSDHLSGVNINTNGLRDMDWQEELFLNATQQNYSLSFSGGEDGSRFRVAASWMNNKGVIAPASFNRMNFSFNLDKKVSNRFGFNTGLYFSRSKQAYVNTYSPAEEGGVILSALASPPFLPKKDAAQEELGGYFVNPLRPQINNVPANINGTFDNRFRTAVLLRFLGNYRIADALKLQVHGTSNIGLDQRHMFMSTRDVYIGRLNKGMAQEDGQERFIWDLKTFLAYEKDFSGHQVSAMAGGGFFGSRNAWNQATGVDYTNDDITLVGRAATKTEAYSNVNNYTSRSWMASGSYRFEDRYFIGLNLRGDGTSRFTENTEVISDPVDPEVWEIKKDPVWGSFMGANLAWNLAGENFLEGSATFSDLTLRLTYGLAGNDGGNVSGRTYPYYWNSPISGFSPDEDYVEKLFPGVGFALLNLQDQRWERSTEWGTGVDMGWFKDRVMLSADYHSRKSTDLIMPDYLDSTYTNSGELSAGGLEIGLNTLNISKNKLKWWTVLNLSWLNNKVEKVNDFYSFLEVGYMGHSNVIKPGKPVYAFWGLETEGIFQNQQEVANHAIQAGAGPGDIRYKDQNGDNVIDEKDRVVLGDPSPDMIICLDNILHFGNFELNVFFFGMIGQDILNLTRMQTEGLNDWINQSSAALRRWTGEGTSNEVPRASVGTNNALLSDRFIEKGSFLRLRNLSLAYRLPLKAIVKTGMKHCKIYLTGQNLLTFTDYQGYDPEVSTMGPLSIDLGAYPNTMYVGAGLSLGF